MRTSVRKLLAAAALAVIALLPTDTARAGEPRAIAAIEDDLVADDPAVRAKAAAELTSRFPDGAVAVPMLVDLLDDESPEVVAAAASAIDAMAVAGAGPVARWCADDARFNSAMPGEPKVSFAKVLTVMSSLKQPRAIDVFDGATDSHPYGPTVPAAGVIAAVMPFDEVTNGMTCLASIVRGSTGDTRTFAAAALAMLGADGLVARGIAAPMNEARASAAAAAIPLVNSNSDLKAWCGCRLLMRLRASDGATVAALTRVLTARKPVLEEFYEPIARAAACRALAVLGPAAAASSATLRAELLKTDNDLGFRAECARTLALCGRESDVAAVLAGKNRDAAYVARAVAMEGRMPDAVIPVLVAALDVRDPNPWLYAAPLASLGPKAAAALPVVRRVGDAARLRSDALICLDAALAIAPGDAEALDRLLVLLRDDSLEEDDAAAAMRILAKRAPVTPAVFARLRKSVADAASSKPSPGWIEAVDGLGRAGAAASDADETLTRLARQAQKDWENVERRLFFADDRQRLAVALGRVAAGGALAVPTLEEWKTKGDETIRVPAAQALRRIRAKK
jgi:hypothetical protein